MGCTARARLGGEGEGVIEGVYDGAINISLRHGLVCLVPEAVERGPLNITVKMPGKSPKMSSLGARAGDRVRVRSGRLELCPRCRVAFRRAPVYWPKREFSSSMLGDGEVAANLDVLRNTALRFGKKAGLGGLLAFLEEGDGPRSTRGLNMFAAAAIPRIVRLEEAFRSDHGDTMSEAIGGLVGLGPGLTPSSDDMLAGLVLLCVLYARSHGASPATSRLITEVGAAELRGKTTLLSEECIRQAALGRGNEPVVRLCEALLTAPPKAVEQETRRVLKIGETSGTDTALGVVLGTMLCTGRPLGLAGDSN